MWQPIETAPKVLGIGRVLLHMSDGQITTGHFNTRVERWFTDVGAFEYLTWVATHWMPLPPPPEKSDDV